MMRLTTALAALLLFSGTAARADDPSIDQLIEQARQNRQDLSHATQGMSLQERRAYFQSHPPPEDSYLNLSKDPQQRAAYDQIFGPQSFRIAHWQAHMLLMHYANQDKPVPELRSGFSTLISGIGGVINSGLAYAGVKVQHLPPERETPFLERADAQMDAANAQLTQVQLPALSRPGFSIPAGPADAFLASSERLIATRQPGASGTFKVMTTVEGWDKAKDMLKNNPANPVLNVIAGDQQLSEQDAAGAKQSYDKALSIDPGNSDALSGRAAANMDLGHVQAAAQDARDALRINPDDAGAKAVLQLAHDTAGGNVSIDKNNPFGQRQNADGSADAAGAWGAGKGGNPGLTLGSAAGLQSSAFTREGFRLLEVGDDASAIKNASKAIALDPKNADAYGVRAFALAHAGDYQGALKDAVASLALDPGNMMAHNARAKALNQMGMYHEALAAADDAIRANPRNAYAYYMKAMALNGLGERKNMLAALGQAAALDPRFQDAFDIAKSAPDEKDLSFLFPEDQLAAARAALRNQQQQGPKRYFWGLTMPTIVIAGLVLFGLLHFVFSWVVPRLRGGYQAAMRTGPSLGSAPTVMASLPEPPPFATVRHTPAGTVLHGQYRRLGQIGSSVHGAVYEGMDQALERRVVIRKLRADMRASDRERLLAPARAAASLAHAGIAPVYSVFEEGEALYLVSEFAPGRSLRDWLAARGALSWEEAQPLFRQVAAALDYAHAKGIVHGAVKASNVMISSEGRAKLTDFGLDRGPLDKKADIQALAACLREAIAGLPPHRLDAVDAALLKAREQLASASQVLDVVESGLASAA